MIMRIDKIDQDAYGRTPFAVGAPKVDPRFSGDPSNAMLHDTGVMEAMDIFNGTLNDHSVFCNAGVEDLLGFHGMHPVTISKDGSEAPYIQEGSQDIFD